MQTLDTADATEYEDIIELGARYQLHYKAADYAVAMESVIQPGGVSEFMRERAIEDIKMVNGISLAEKCFQMAQVDQEQWIKLSVGYTGDKKIYLPVYQLKKYFIRKVAVAPKKEVVEDNTDDRTNKSWNTYIIF